MSTANPPMVTINVPGEPVPGLLEKVDSTTMPIVLKDDKSDQGQRPLYQNLDDPSMPMRRSVHRRRSFRHRAQITLQLHRVSAGDVDKDHNDSQVTSPIPTAVQFVSSERPKESPNVSIEKGVGYNSLSKRQGAANGFATSTRK